MIKTTMKMAMAILGAVAMGHASADVKIGFLATLSGPSAENGIDQLDGFNLAVEQLGGLLGGEKVIVVKEDDQLKPEIAIASVTKLLDRDKVDVVTGLTFANIFMALQGKIGATDVPFIGSVAGPSPTAGAQCKPNLFVTSWQSDGPAEAMGKYMEDKGLKRISTFTPNFVGGKDKIAGLKRFYKGQISDEMYTPLNQLDFSAELTQVSANKPDAIFAFYVGGLAPSFVRQYQQMGLLGKVPLYTTNTLEGAAIDVMGSAANGLLVADAWTPGMNNPQSKQFVAAYEKKYGRMPSSFAAYSYDTGMLLDAAIRSANGKVDNRKAFAKAIATAQFKSVSGDFRFGKNNYPVQDYHVFQIWKEGNRQRTEFKLVAEGILKGHADAFAPQCPLK